MAILSSLSSRNIVPWKGNSSALTLDSYFKNTTLYIQNKLAPTWNSDASTNNFLLLENGNVRASAASPYNQSSGNWSNYFTGSSSYLTFPDSTAFQFGTGDFTVEAWVNTPATTNTFGKRIVNHYYYPSSDLGWLLSMNRTDGTQNLGFQGFSGGVASINLVYNSAITANQWHHVAVSRKGSTASLFLDGARVATQSGVTWNDTTPISFGLGIGAQPDVPTGTTFDGYISNVRITKGSYVYDPGLLTCTVPTVPLTAISGTTLLTCQDNRFVDNGTANSGSGFLSTAIGSPAVQAFNPFITTNAGGTGSGYFDGSSYLQVTPTSILNLASNDFTIEVWANFNSASGTQVLQDFGFGGGAALCYVFYYSGSSINFDWSINGISGNGPNSLGSFTPAVGSWYHIAVVRNGNVFTGYVNGVALNAPKTQTGAINYNAGSNFRIGVNATNYFAGYMSNFRIVNGTAVYTGNFTPPIYQLPATQPASTNISSITSGTQLLTLQYSQSSNTSTFLDSSSRNTLVTRLGNTHQGSFSPFSQRGWSNYFNGSDSYLTFLSNAAYQFNSGDFTVELWVYFNTVANAQFLTIPVVGALYFQYFAGALDFGNNSSSLSAAWSPIAGTWYHLAAVRNGSNFTTYVNGSVHATTSSAFNFTATGDLKIGQGGAGYFNGYISNVRFVKGTAVYTTAFTPPTAPLTAISGTSLLTCQSNRFIDNSSNSIASTRTGTPYVQPFSPFIPNISYNPATQGGSAYFDGSGDQLQSPRVFLATHPFTIEGWIYISADVSAGTHVFWGSSNGGGGQPKLSVYITSNVLYTDIDGTPGSGPSVSSVSTYINRGTWNHIALCRTSTSASASEIYINGVSRATGTIGDRTAMTAVWQVGGAEGGVATAGTYIASFRLSIGIRRYTSNFTLPTGLFTADQYTVLLLNFNDAGFYDSAERANFETVGFPQVGIVKKKNNLASTYYPQRTATGDYFVTGDYTSTPIYDLGTGDFTVEAWINLSTLSFDNSNIAPIISYGNGGANGPLGLGTAWSLNITQGSPYSIVWYRNIDASTQYNNAFNLGAGDLVINTWQKIAVTRKNGLLAAFLNDQQVSTALDNSINYNSLSGANRLWAGIQTGGGGANQYYRFPGYIDDIRVTRGVARYAPTASRPTTFDYLVVGGGGGGGRFIAGGGGAGGVLSSATSGAYTLSVSSLTVTVGNGGGSTANGGNSVLGTLTATGGGQGGTADFGPSGQNGGSGGGGAAPNGTSGGTGVAGPPRQGYNGGSGQGRGGGSNAAAGGGGGAGAQGQNSQSDQQPGAGGIGITTTIITTGMATTNSVGVVSGGSVYFAGGGGGGGDGQGNVYFGAGGLGGGGIGYSNSDGTSSPANTGGGGGGAGAPPRSGGSGGSGVVIMAYPSNFNNITTITGLTYVLDTTSRPGYKVYIFKSGSGTISW